jgi:chaperonin GroEL (HSP60 family)
LVYIDPTKVVRAALQGAASVAGLLITFGGGMNS